MLRLSDSCAYGIIQCSGSAQELETETQEGGWEVMALLSVPANSAYHQVEPA